MLHGDSIQQRKPMSIYLQEAKMKEFTQFLWAQWTPFMLILTKPRKGLLLLVSILLYL